MKRIYTFLTVTALVAATWCAAQERTDQPWQVDVAAGMQSFYAPAIDMQWKRPELITTAGFGKPLGKKQVFEVTLQLGYARNNYQGDAVFLQLLGKYQPVIAQKIEIGMGLGFGYRLALYPSKPQRDRYSNDQLENVTLWNNYLGSASYSWGGIAGTPTDAILFYEALMNGNVVSAASLQQMTTWFQGQDSEAPDYGLGIEYWQFQDGSTPQRGHEGDGIGNSAMILYVPDNNTYLYINCTAGRKFFGPYLFKITDSKNELAGYIARWR